MGRYLLRRIGLALLTLWLMSVAVFVVTAVMPGDVARVILGQFATPDAIAALHTQLHLDDPAPLRYVRWITGFLSGNWGTSTSNGGAAIADLLPGRLVNSLILAVVALAVVAPLAIGLGLLAALRRDTLLDRFISITSLTAGSVPEFVTGTALLFIFGIWLHWLPTDSIAASGLNPLQSPQHLVLPVFALGLVYVGYLSRMMRATTITVLDSAYVRTALLKGMPWSRVLLHHVVRNAVAPTLTVVALQVGYLVGGLVVVEQLFDYPGIGTLLLSAAQARDVPLLEDCVMCTSILFFLGNLLSDMVNLLLNPRIRHDAARE
jgi:peptide/nickel transport system permease protein